MERMNGKQGELLNFLITEQQVPERKCKRLMREILYATDHLHQYLFFFCILVNSPCFIAVCVCFWGETSCIVISSQRTSCSTTMTLRAATLKVRCSINTHHKKLFSKLSSNLLLFYRSASHSFIHPAGERQLWKIEVTRFRYMLGILFKCGK